MLVGSTVAKVRPRFNSRRDLILSFRRRKCATSLGAFVVINKDG